MIIRVRNILQNNAPQTFLSSQMGAGTTTLSVKNINGLTSGWAVQIGDTGEERSEIKVINSTPSAGTFGLSAGLSYDHPADTPVYAIKFDKLIFKRSTSGTAGTATAITDGTVSISADSEFTQFDDTSGSTSYGYRASFYSSGLAAESPNSNWLTPTGYTFYSLAKIRERAKEKLFSAGYLKADDSQVNNWINEWLETMNNAAISVDKEYGMGTVDVAFGTSGLGTITSTDFQEVKRMWITYNGNDFYRATKMGVNDYYPNETFNSTHPYFDYQDDDVFEIKPAETGGTARLTYYKMRTFLSDDTDQLPVVMRPYTRSFVDYCVGEAYYNDGKQNLGREFMTRAEAQKRDFINMITPRNKTGIQVISLTDPLDSDDGTWEIL